MGSQRLGTLAAEPGGGALYAVAGSRVFRSTGAGTGWQPLTYSLPIGPPVEKGDVLVVAGGEPATLFLARGTQLFRGTAGGADWQEVLDAPTRIAAILVDPDNPLSVFAGPEQPTNGLPPPTFRSPRRGSSRRPHREVLSAGRQPLGRSGMLSGCRSAPSGSSTT